MKDFKQNRAKYPEKIETAQKKKWNRDLACLPNLERQVHVVNLKPKRWSSGRNGRHDERDFAKWLPMKKRILSPRKAERLRRETEKALKGRWAYRILFAVLAVIGIVVGAAVTLYQGKLAREEVRQDKQQPASTNKNDLKTSSTQEETITPPSSTTNQIRQP